MLKSLRIAVTALSLTACVLLSVLWVRSYWWTDTVAGPLSETKRLVIGSVTGWLQFRLDDRKGEPVNMTRWRLKSDSLQRLYDQIRALHKGARIQPIGETAHFGMNGDTFFMPYWFPVLVTCIMAAALGIWRRCRLSFSLRTLLIATTLVAVVLGIVVAAR